MRKLITGALGLQACLLLMFAGVAQAEDKPPEVFTYATYFVCDVVTQERSDEIFKQVDQPLLDAAVADGSLAAYGLYEHQTGGRWRRVAFTSANSIQGLLESQKKVGDQADAKNKKLEDEYGKICNTHDDYIWHRIAGNAGTAKPGSAVFSTYYVCNSREAQADALVTQVYAAQYDKMVAEGKLTSWGWMEHVVGAQFRRLATMSAPDLKSLMEARASIVEMQDNELGNIFTDICDSHADYIWNVIASGNR